MPTSLLPTLSSVHSRRKTMPEPRRLFASICAAALTLLVGCSGSSSTSGTVRLTPNALQFCDPGQSLPLSASVTGDSSGRGVTWSLSGPGSLSSSNSVGVIYIAPGSVAAPVTSTVTATSIANPSLTASTSVAVNPAPAITTTALPNATAGTPYSATLAGSGGVTPYTWTLATGSSLPAGLTLNSQTGVVSGTPTANGATTFSVTLSDLAAPPLSATMQLSLVVGATLAISTSTLPAGDYGVPYASILVATGGVGPYRWSASGSLPPGLTLSSSGLLAGNPSGGGTYTVTAQVADSGSPAQITTRQLSVSIASALTITTLALPSVAVSSGFSAQLTATGGVGVYTWSLAPGSSLPLGLTLSSSGLLSGRPTQAGSSAFKINIADSNNPAQIASGQLTLVVAPALSITTASLPNAALGSLYSATLLSSGGTLPVSWSLAAGSKLPAGLSLSPLTGAITGTPSAIGAFSFAVAATDSSSPQQTATQMLTLSVTQPAPLTIVTSSLPGGVAGFSYDATLTATGGIAPLSWSVASGALPAALTLNPATGLISGKPSAAAPASFTVQVADSAIPAHIATQALTITVTAQLGSSAGNAVFKGTYAFLFRGFLNGSVSGQVYGNAAIGVLTADGNGNVTGTEDTNTPSGVNLQVPITGEFAIGSDHRGMLVLNNGASVSTFAIVAGSLNAGVAQQVHLIEFDDTSSSGASGGVGSGVALLQTASAFTPSTLKASFVYGLTGETPCNLCASSVNPYGPVTAVGQLAGDGSGNLAGEEDSAATNAAYAGIVSAGTYASPNATTGRGTLSLTRTGSSFPAAPGGFVYYIVNTNELLMMSTDSHATTSLLSGEAHLQTQTGFSNTSMSGTSVLWGTNAVGGDGIAQYPAQLSSTLSLLSVSSGGSVFLNQDSNRAGVYTSVTNIPVSYTVAANGRSAFTVSGSPGPVFYLYANDTGLGIDLSHPGGAPGLTSIAPQTITTSFPAFLTGVFTEFNWPAPISVTAFSGRATLTANSGGIDGGPVTGSIATTVDSSSATGSLISAQGSSLLYSEDPFGRVTVTQVTGGSATAIVYAISPSEAVQIPTASAVTPAIAILQQ